MKFKCKQSGNVFEFYTDHDIKTMREHPEYEEVKQITILQEDDSKEEPVKKVGRPKKY